MLECVYSVSRIEARSEEFGVEMQLDVNTELYPIRVGEKFMMALAPTLSLNGSAVTNFNSKPYRVGLQDSPCHPKSPNCGFEYALLQNCQKRPLCCLEQGHE
ncbi:hypothetical protein U1Q18_005279 [Sarracenia purpurea var. burkii]